MHAPANATKQPTRLTPFKPTSVKKPTPAPPPATKPMNTITLVQSVKDGKALSSINYPSLIATINAKIAEAAVKEKPADEKPIRIRSVHQYPSNDIVIYTTTPSQAEILREQHENWIPLISTELLLHNPIHAVVVHGIPTSFNPSDPQHLDMLYAMNTDTLTPPPLFVKWLSANAVQRGASHSSLRIGFAEAGQAALAVEQKIFYGRYNKRTEHGRKIKPRCMNCLQEGHITRYCKEPLMCPFCSGPHPADSCEFHGKMTSNCTACARHAQRQDESVDLRQLFSETPRHLRHSPLDPTCPARLASKTVKAAAAGQQLAPPAPHPTVKQAGVRGATATIVLRDGDTPPNGGVSSVQVTEDNDTMVESS